MTIHLDRLEVELKKRLDYPYHWGRKQNDDWDKQTNFIYQTRSFLQLKNATHHFDEQLKNYAFNRWLNFWSAKGIEQIFCNNPMVIQHQNIYDKHIDFYINNMPFDHKTSVFPKGFNRHLQYAIENKIDLIKWLYLSQSKEGRQHYKNRLFIILFNHTGEHWKLKTEIQLIKHQIEKYLQNFNFNHLSKLYFNHKYVYSDIIWVIQ